MGFRSDGSFPVLQGDHSIGITQPCRYALQWVPVQQLLRQSFFDKRTMTVIAKVFSVPCEIYELLHRHISISDWA